MIVSAILGGIGNQMFQYAAARALAADRDASLLLDLSGFQNYALHQGYELQRVFGIDHSAVTVQQVKDVFGWRGRPLVRKVLKRKLFSSIRGQQVAIEPHFQYWPELHSKSEPIYMMGYWQSERYFKKHDFQIRSGFTFRAPLLGSNLELVSAMSDGESVSLHVRRGDYVSDRRTRKIMSTCSIAYYRQAVIQMGALVRNPTYYVFSDDMDWVRRNLSFLPAPIYVQHNRGVDSYIDMQLMSSCKHNIIGNSSFSWWGAWLNSNPEKVVIAPKNWFCDGTNDEDLIPENWSRL